MKVFSLKKLCLVVCLFAYLVGSAQNMILSPSANVSVITCDVGKESYSLFGHTAIRISDLKNNLDVVYNYGAFDFNTANFVGKFAKGDLQYFAVVHSFPDFMSQYTYEQRSVFEQELKIPLPYKQKIFNSLNAVLASDNNHYTYKFIDRNCTTMVVDILNKTLGGRIISSKFDDKSSYRSILFPYFDAYFYEQLGTSIIFGSKVDESSNHIFLPLELNKILMKTKFKNKLLCKESFNLLKFNPQKPILWWNNIYIYISLLVIIVTVNKKSIDFIYVTLVGLLGIFFIIVGFVSNHQELSNNYNVLLFNPILPLIVYFSLVKSSKWISNICMISIFLLAIYTVIISGKVHFWIVLPLLITNYIILQRIGKVRSITYNY